MSMQEASICIENVRKPNQNGLETFKRCFFKTLSFLAKTPKGFSQAVTFIHSFVNPI